VFSGKKKCPRETPRALLLTAIGLAVPVGAGVGPHARSELRDLNLLHAPVRPDASLELSCRALLRRGLDEDEQRGDDNGDYDEGLRDVLHAPSIAHRSYGKH
jgi:hypothetical protein